MSPAAVDGSAARLKHDTAEPEADIDLGPGMFDEDAAGMLNVAPTSKPKTLEDLVGPWGGYGTSKKKGSKIKSTPHLAQTISSIHPFAPSKCLCPRRGQSISWLGCQACFISASHGTTRNAGYGW